MTDKAEVILDSVNLKYESTATLKVSDRNNWALKLRILLEPKFMENGIQLIGPPGLLVVVSWVSLGCTMYKMYIPYNSQLPMFCILGQLSSTRECYSWAHGSLVCAVDMFS